jgi:hypothetical protein
MIAENDTYIIFWKPYRERYADFMKLLKECGMYVPKLLENYWPFEKINLN